MKYEEKLLKTLVEGYRKSKKDSGENKTNRRTKLKPEKLYKKYNANDGDFEEISKLNDTAEALIQKGFITCEKESFGTQIQSIYMVDEKIYEIEQYLSQKYGFLSKDMQLQAMRKLTESYHNASPVCEKECARIEKLIKARQVIKNIKEQEDIFKMVTFLEHNQEDLYVREASVKVYGDSKYFEVNTLNAVCALLRKYARKPCDKTEMTDEILFDYNVYKEPQKISIKGKAVLDIAGVTTDISALAGGIEIMASDLPDITGIHIDGSKFMTIENRTSYLRFHEDDTVTFYLGGYANRFQRDFIRMIHRDNPGLGYLHFGDIDAGGFWIHRNLCEITGVDFKLFCMSEEQLKDKAYAGCIHELEGNDRTRLRELGNIAAYKSIVSYMLKNNAKLEQEIISLDLMKRSK